MSADFVEEWGVGQAWVRNIDGEHVNPMDRKVKRRIDKVIAKDRAWLENELARYTANGDFEMMDVCQHLLEEWK